MLKFFISEFGILLFSAFSVFGNPTALGHSILKLIVEPGKHDSELVVTLGYISVFEDEEWHPMNGKLYLYPTKEYAEFDSNFSFIVVDSTDKDLLEKLRTLNGTYVTLEGRFEAFKRVKNVAEIPPGENAFGSGKLMVEKILNRKVYIME